MSDGGDRLTRKNVDEQIQCCLSLPRGSQAPTASSLTRTVQDLQCIYEEDRRLELVWRRINSRVSALNAKRQGRCNA
jgi:hypothetical protein